MSLTPGTRIGPYEVVDILGAGGMGEVYRARDPRLGRDVALKVLPDLFASDPERLARFQQEAKVLAALKHANIGAIYGLEEGVSDRVRALVLELVEGDTLADRIARGPIPIDDSLRIATQIAKALEAAHDQGVIHRDLKPANIKITPEGVVKVLDFGLAKLIDPAGRILASGPHGPAGSTGQAALTQSPTLAAPMMTGAGMILGTAAYMAPEQAKGRTADKRSDVWSFGCVLYEMLSGKSPFHGEDVTEIIAAIVRGTPDWAALPQATPPTIRRLLRTCLEKDRQERLRDIGDARIEIRDTLAGAGDAPQEQRTATAPPVWRRLLAPTLGLIAGAALAGTSVWFFTRPVAPPVTRTTITPAGAAALTISAGGRHIAITPDGRRIVYLGSNGTQLLVRALDQLEPTIVVTGGQPRDPFVSPDGQWVGYFDEAANALKKVPVGGGSSITLTRVSDTSWGATWGADHTIVFATTSPQTGLSRIPDSGGEPTVLTRPDHARELDHAVPEFLPGANAVLYTIFGSGGPGGSQVALFDLRTGTSKRLIPGGRSAYVASGHLVSAFLGTIRAVAFDLDRLEATGTPTQVVENVATEISGQGDFAVAANGTLAYVPGGDVVAAKRTLTWVDRQGSETPLAAPPRAYQYPRISPDGTRVALDIRDQDNDIWIWHLVRSTLTRFTLDPGQDEYPLWTPDSRRLLFHSSRTGVRHIYWQAADGTGQVEQLTDGPNDQRPTSITPDSTGVILRENTSSGWDLMLLALDPARRAQPPSPGAGGLGRAATSNVRPLTRAPSNEHNGELSPNGQWLAYESDESGRNEIYVRPFPNVDGGRWQVSTGGGIAPLWAHSGRELFYRAFSGGLMRMAVEPGAAWAAGSPAQMFDGRTYYLGVQGSGRTYDISQDGQRFLMIRQAREDGSGAAGMIVVQNWFADLKRVVPTK